MISLMSDVLHDNRATEHMPKALIAQAHDASREPMTPQQAKATYDTLAPALHRYQPDQTFCIACGVLIEKQRQTEGMLDFWADLQDSFPDNLTALRMLMRWYRRERRVDAGIARLHVLFANSHNSLTDAEFATLGFAELRAFDEIDQLMTAILPAHPTARAIRMRYIKILNQQSRYLDAQAIADSVSDVEKMGPSSRALIDTANRRAAKMSQLYTHHAADVFSRIIDILPVPKTPPIQAFGAISFYTGQLGTGGAERQMARIAAAFQARFQSGETAHDLIFTAPTDVVVRHTNAQSGGDFYVPTLRRAGVATTSLSKSPDVALTALRDVPADVINLLELLPEDVFETTCKLIPYYQERRTQVAYLWQDGGVLFAALAALIAGVPRIVTSFRGLPPNLRPYLYRPELSVLYKALAKLPQVTFSANSQVAATAYEDWLGLSAGQIIVLPNAMLPVLPTGADTDQQDWEDITRKSPGCTQTVIGVFRFDDNKRPLFWLDVAAAHIKQNPNTRFIMIGTGYLFGQCKEQIAARGLANRVFLTGVRENIGFYMHKADLLMHLARMEGLPNVLIEAQLAGVPVLATPAGGTAEVVCDDKTGEILGDADDPSLSHVTAKLSALLADCSRLSQLGAAAREHATPRFLINSIIDRTAELFAQPLGPTL